MTDATPQQSMSLQNISNSLTSALASIKNIDDAPLASSSVDSSYVGSSIPTTGSIASALFYARVQLVAKSTSSGSIRKELNADMGGFMTPGGGALFGDIYLLVDEDTFFFLNR